MAKKLLKKLIDIFIDRPKIDNEFGTIPAEKIPTRPPIHIKPEIVNPPIEPPKPVEPPKVEK